MIIAMIVIFYFFMIRPQSKKQKEIKMAREAMQKGDKVITQGGIFGTISSINEADGTMLIEISKDVRIKVSREYVYPAGKETLPEKKENSSDLKK